MRIAVGGIGHETNTFSTLRTSLEDFTVRRGEECVQGDLWDRFRSEGIEFAPTLIAGAMPNGVVLRSAYEPLKAELISRLHRHLPFDGLFLTLHGAMEVEEIGDGETDILAAIRALVGPDLPIAVSLDLHGNLSPELIASANIFSALRTAPHVDGPQTRERTLTRLVRCIREGARPVTAMVKLPMIESGEWAVTGIEPCKSLYASLFEIEQKPGIWDASIMIGCAWTDSPYTSVSPLVVADTADIAQAEAQALADAVWARRTDFGPEVEVAPVHKAIRIALEFESPGTVFISDAGDNPTAGGAGDMPLFLDALLKAGVSNALIAGIADAEAFALCRETKAGKRVTLSLGGKLDAINAGPLDVSAQVLGVEGNMAVVQIQGVTVVITEKRGPFLELSAFVAAGVDPLDHRIVVVKQGYLAPELRDIAAFTVMALSPGFTDLRLDKLPYRRIHRPIFPLDPM